MEQASDLSDWEKWHFDHHGFLVLEDVVPAADVARMVEVGAAWHRMTEQQLPSPLVRSAPITSPPPPTYINHLQYGDEAYHRLALNPEILRVVRALTGGRFTLVDTALTCMKREGGTLNEGGFHGELGVHVPGSHQPDTITLRPSHGDTEPGRQHADYHVTAEGVPFAGFLNCGISLVDVPSGMGFVCLPGSHKRNFRPPDNDGSNGQSLAGPGVRQISLYDGPPTVYNFCPKKGTCIVFTEALRHGIRSWDAEYDRLTVFNR